MNSFLNNDGRDGFWSIEAWCASQESIPTPMLESAATQTFLERLNCPTIHPFCSQFNDTTYPIPGIPPQGPLLHADHWETVGDVLMSTMAMTLPPLLAMAELWLRLFACVVAPWGIVQLLTTLMVQSEPSNEPKNAPWFLRQHLPALLTLASTLVLATDVFYVLEFGPGLGRSLLTTAMVLVWFQQSKNTNTTGNLHTKFPYYNRVWVVLTLLGWMYLSSSSSVTSTSKPLPEGLFYDTSSPTAQAVVDHWPEPYRTFDHGTPWFPTGDSRTGLPFLIYSIPQPPVWNRVWLSVEDNTEVVALDIAFPSTGYDPDQPVYLVLHGLNGGSQEAFVQDFCLRRLKEQATVVVMVARGLMDLPVRGWNIFHGARWQDAHAASLALRRAVGDSVMLVGVGYSMGAIVLGNLLSRVGKETALSAAVSVSGGLDMREELYFTRAARLWQPIITPELRDTFVVGKFGERVRHRLSKAGLKKLMRATHVTAVDIAAVVEYNGFRDIDHYYSEMSALGDVPVAEYLGADAFDPSRRM